jgi:acyl dehydratase
VIPSGVAPGSDIPPLSRTVARDDLIAYAELSGDRNPLHQDEAVARAAGFDGIIAHGMFTLGHLAACLDRWIGPDASVRRLSGQFRAPVFVGEEIVAGGRVKSVDGGSGTVVVELWVTVVRDGVTEHAVRRGEAEVRFAQSGS